LSPRGLRRCLCIPDRRRRTARREPRSPRLPQRVQCGHGLDCDSAIACTRCVGLPDLSFVDTCRDLLALLQKEVREQFSVEAVDEGCLIRTPYLFPDNDPIEIVVKGVGEGGRVRLSDADETLGLLCLQGVDLKGRSKQEWHMATALRR